MRTAEKQATGKHTFKGLAVAIFVAPTATALCLDVALLLDQRTPPIAFWDWIGGTIATLLIALTFGGLLAAVPVLLLGGIVISVARSLGTKSALFFAGAGILAGIAMAWLDTQRTQSAFTVLDASPFLIGGASSALSYWWVAERNTRS